MSLLNLFFGRRIRQRFPGASAFLAEKVEIVDGPTAVIVGPEAGEASADTMIAPPDLSDGEAGRAPVKTRAVLEAILGRSATLVLDAESPVSERQAVVLRRLGIIHDPNEVTLCGRDRSAHLVIADRRLLSARFSAPDTAELVFDFRREPAEVEAAMGCVRALSDFCTAPVDLLISERPFSGVFSGAGGFAIADASFDEETCREAFAAALAWPDDAADEGMQSGQEADGLDAGAEAPHPAPTASILVLTRAGASEADAAAPVSEGSATHPGEPALAEDTAAFQAEPAKLSAG